MTELQTLLDEFFSHYPTRIYKKGAVMIDAGAMPHAFYITDGMVEQCDVAAGGNKQVLNLYKKGAFIPLASILNNIPSRFYFEAADDVVVRIAPCKDVAKFLEDNPPVVLDALRRVSRGSEGLMARLAAAMDSSAEQRIMQELTIMKARKIGHGSDIAISETTLAAHTGLARETVNRALGRLQAKGSLTVTRGHITLL